MRSRRSCLSVPGASERMLAKARGLLADEVVIDLEDAVTPGRKDEARAAAIAATGEGEWSAGSVAVRVNSPGTAWGAEDVSTLGAQGGAALTCLVVPKVESAEELEAVDRLLVEAEENARREPRLGLQALIETAAGLRAVHEIAAASPRLEALIIGYADLAASLGRVPGADYPGDRWHWVRETVLVAARAAGLQAIDGPHLDVEDLDGLAEEASRARTLGLDGKWAVHPSQIEPLNDAFSPSQEEVDHAGATLAALTEAEDGAVMLHGQMVDEASRKLAAQVVARGKAAGIEPGGR
jgi:citrate lyase subunit beta/citryl-CoA lyase